MSKRTRTTKRPPEQKRAEATAQLLAALNADTPQAALENVQAMARMGPIGISLLINPATGATTLLTSRVDGENAEDLLRLLKSRIELALNDVNERLIALAEEKGKAAARK